MIRIFERTSISQHILSSVALDTTGYEETVAVTSTDENNVHMGVLKGVNVSCGSQNFNVSIRSATKSKPNTRDEIFRYDGANSKLLEDDLNVGWINGDTPRNNYLYIVVTNKDLSNATGAINIQLTNDIHRRYTK